MKRIKIWSVIFAFIFAIHTLHADTKRYEVKSGIIEYKTSGSGNLMGIKTEISGTNKVIFKEWGNIELNQGKTKTVIMGKEETTQDTTKIENGKVYIVDYAQKVIHEYGPAMLMYSQHKDLAKSSKEMISNMGGKKIGQETILGYDCEVWEIPQTKLWLYKGLALKAEANMMGITNTMQATKVQLDVSVSDEDLKLPDFPVKSAEDSDTQIPQMTPEQMEQMQEMMKNFTQK